MNKKLIGFVIIMLSLFLMGVWEFWGRENMAYEEILVLKEPLGASSLLTEECFKTMPELKDLGNGHMIACHLYK